MNFSTYREGRKTLISDDMGHWRFQKYYHQSKKKSVHSWSFFKKKPNPEVAVIYLFLKKEKSSANFARWNISMYLKSQFAIFFAHGETLDDQFAHSICSLWCYCSHDQNSALPIFFLFAIWCHEVVKQDLCNALLSEHSGLN